MGSTTAVIYSESLHRARPYGDFLNSSKPYMCQITIEMEITTFQIFLNRPIYSTENG